jgi:hypothetical protein
LLLKIFTQIQGLGSSPSSKFKELSKFITEKSSLFLLEKPVLEDYSHNTWSDRMNGIMIRISEDEKFCEGQFCCFPRILSVFVESKTSPITEKLVE